MNLCNVPTLSFARKCETGEILQPFDTHYAKQINAKLHPSEARVSTLPLWPLQLTACM